MWDEIIYPFPNFNGCIIEVLGKDDIFHPKFYDGSNYSSILESKLIHVSKEKTPEWEFILIRYDSYIESTPCIS